VTFLFSTAFPLLTGFLLMNWLGPWTGPPGEKALPKLLLGAGLGVAASSCLTFAGLFFLPMGNTWQFLLEGVVAFVLLILVVGISRRRGTPLWRGGSENSAGEGIGLPRAAVYAALLLATGLAAASFWHISSARPHGNWDAWAIWNMRARFLFRDSEHWRNAFSPLLSWSHPDYPLLVPASVARIWRYMGGESTLGPSLLAGAFTFGAVVVLVLSLDDLVGRPQGALAGLFLLSSSSFVRHGASQYADVPLGFYILLANVFLRMSADGERKYGTAALAGMSAGFAAWTKNEGMLFLVAIAVSMAIPLVFSRARKAGFQRIAGFGAGLAPVAAVIAVFKTGLALPSEMLLAQGTATLWGKLSDWERYGTVLRNLAGEFASGYPMILLLAAYAFLAGVGASKERRIGVMEVFSGLMVMLLGYIMVYVTTPHPLQWQLDNSLGRLLTHLWPSFVFACFLALNSPFARDAGVPATGCAEVLRGRESRWKGKAPRAGRSR